jgi:hypothetical protein
MGPGTVFDKNWAFGTGTFITGEAVYSIKIIGLTVAEAGLGLTIVPGAFHAHN